MRTTLLIFLTAIVIQKAVAQITAARQDTLAYYLTKGGALSDKEHADYLLMIMPCDLSVKNSTYPVFEFYPNGKRKLIGSSLTQSRFLTLDGTCITFFPNGRRKSTGVFQQGKPVGEATEYFPNGQLYTLKKYQDRDVKYMECRDSTGTVLATNGNGQWISYNDDFTRKERAGKVKNGSLQGYFMPFADIERDVAYDKTGEILKKPDVQPSYKGGMEAFHPFLNRNIKYPAVDRENNITGNVYISLLLKKTGN